MNPRLRVGGPATAQAAWVDRFIKHVVENNVPVDFVSTHVYGNDAAKECFRHRRNYPAHANGLPRRDKVHDQVKASARPDLPIFFTEYNASYKNEPEVTDAPFMGPWLADTIRQCDGLTANPELLGLFRRVRRTRRGEGAVLRGFRPDGGGRYSRSPLSTHSNCCTNWETSESRSIRRTHW